MFAAHEPRTSVTPDPTKRGRQDSHTGFPGRFPARDATVHACGLGSPGYLDYGRPLVFCDPLRGLLSTDRCARLGFAKGGLKCSLGL